LSNLKITFVADFNSPLHVRPQNLPCMIYGRLNCSSLNPMTIKFGKQYSSAKKRIAMSTNWSSGWRMLTCNMGCSRQSMMKFCTHIYI